VALSPFPVLEEAEFPLKVPGETLLSEWHVTAAVVDYSAVKGRGIEGMGLTINDFTAYFDLDKTGDILVTRTRHAGDRFQPLGMRQPKKLGQFMIDARIPHAWRQRVPIVCSPSQILWIVGWRIDERVKVTDATRRVLSLKFEWG
jgi:tRNA(Ile)-lysidine synthase